MSLRKFENHIRQSVEEHQSPLDTDALWEALEPQLEEPAPTRRVPFWIFWLIGALVLIPVAIYVLTPSAERNGDQEVTLSFLPNEMGDNPKEDSIYPNSNEIPKPISNTSISITSVNELNSSSTISPEPIPNRSQLRGATITRAENANLNHIIRFEEESFIDQVLEKVPDRSIQKNDERSLSNAPIPARIDLEISQRKPLEVFNSLVISPLPLLDFSKEEEWTNSNKIQPVKQSLWNPQLGLSLTAMTNFRSLDAPDEFASYKQRRNDTERSLETIGFGIDFRSQHRKGWLWEVGIQGMQMTERFNRFSVGPETYVEENALVGLEIHNPQDTNFIYGQRIRTRTIITTEEVFNTYRWLEGNVGIGYVKPIGKIQVGINGGLLYGVGLKMEGRIFAAEDGFLDLNEAQSSQFRSNFGLGFYGGLSVMYPIHPNWSIGSQVLWKGYTRGINQEVNPITQRHSWAGMKLGLYMNL